MVPPPVSSLPSDTRAHIVPSGRSTLPLPPMPQEATDNGGDGRYNGVREKAAATSARHDRPAGGPSRGKCITMTRQEIARPVRWYLLIWLLLLYIWGVLGMDWVGWKVVTLVAIFTLAIGPLVGLLWLGLSGGVRPRWSLPYFSLLGILAAAASLSAHQNGIVLGIFLALILGCAVILKRVRAIIWASGVYLVAMFLCTLGVVIFNTPYMLPILLDEPIPALSKLLESLVSTPNDFLGNVFPGIYLALILFVVGFLLLYGMQMRAHTRLTAAHAQLQISAQRIEELTLLTERQRLARELHDTLAQGLAGLILQLQVSESYLSQSAYERARAILQLAIQRARTSLADARLAIDDLRVDLRREYDLEQAVAEEVAHFVAATGLACQTDLADLAVVPSAWREHVLRSVAEGLTNVARHARASHVWVTARCEGSQVAVEVRDDGVGFDPETLQELVGHYGLLGLRERARTTGGSLTVTSVPAKGTNICLAVPTSSVEGM